VDRYPTTQQEWRDLHQAVRTFAFRLTRSHAHADDLTQEAFKRLMTTRAWNPATVPSLAKHMMMIVKSVLSHERQSRQGDLEMQASIEQQTVDGGAARSAEQMSLDQGGRDRSQRSAARRLAALRERLAGFDLELELIDLTQQEVDSRAEQAKRVGRPVGEVYEAWRRIRRYAAGLPDAMDADDGEEVA